jgi:hypothetical protein
MPHLLDLIDIEAERLRQPGLGQPRRDTDAQRAGGQLEQGKAAGRIELVEHRRQRARRLGAPERGQPIDDRGETERARIHFGRDTRRLGPEKRDGLGQIATKSRLIANSTGSTRSATSALIADAFTPGRSSVPVSAAIAQPRSGSGVSRT